MVENLSIYTLKDDGTSVSFPQSNVSGQTLSQAAIGSYTFTAGRMGSVNIQATLMYPICLDNYWSQKEYVEFRGEKYFIFSTPTSSKSNDDLRYKHELNFVSERAVLDNTYFFDVVTENATDVDQFVSNSTSFTFFGDIAEFAKRLGYSLAYSKVGYSVVVDDGITSEAELMSFEDKYFSEVLQEVFNTYEIPYYFVGKVIHIGYTSNAITHEFKYGYDRELLSIKKTNANYKIVNRCTGIGSSENLPYYYPNETKKTYVGVEADSDNVSINTADITITNENTFKKNVSVNEEIRYDEYIESNLESQAGQLFMWCDEDLQYEYTLGNSVTLKDSPDEGAWVNYFYVSLYPSKTGTYVFELSDYNLYRAKKDGGVVKSTFIAAGISGNKSKWDIKEKGGSSITFSVSGNKLTANLTTGKVYSLSVQFIRSKRDEINTGDSYYFYYKVNGVKFDYHGYSWILRDNPVTLSSIGISIEKAPYLGDKFRQIKTEGTYMSTSQNLLPPIYRETLGAERFYNAKNDTYISPETGEYYNFENEYTDGNPKEQIVTFDYIKPTIKGMKNASNQLLGEIAAVAFDDDDNDEIDSDTNEYEHPYFYIKLHKFDGTYGFNIFESGIVGGDMTIAVTSGNCAACNFQISVLEIKSDDGSSSEFKNPVQVDSSGNIVAGNQSDKWDETNIQSERMDTTTNEVWIRVSKDDSTFGVVMPSNTRNYKPKAGDTFVITNIDLPKQYILNAENELKEAIIKYMAANNSEKFNFSINFKRIFFAEYPDVLDELNENARILVEYNGSKYTLYVNNYTYKVNENEILPEISVELADTITIRKGTLQKSIDAVKQDIMSSVGSMDFLKIGLKYFIRKDVDDSSDSHLVLRNGLYVTKSSEAENSIQEENNSIQEDGNAIQEDSNTVNAEETEQILTVSAAQYVTDESDVLSQKKNAVLNEIVEYYNSSDVKSFSLGEDSFWIEDSVRLSIRYTSEIKKKNGEESSKIWNGDKCYDIPIDSIIGIIDSLHIYSDKCYNVMKNHKLNVLSLESEEEILNYDYKCGYPEKLIFDL